MDYLRIGLGSDPAALIAKIMFRNRFAKPPVGLYLVMSWFALLVFNKIMRDIGGLSLTYLLIGGASIHQASFSISGEKCLIAMRSGTCSC